MTRRRLVLALALAPVITAAGGCALPVTVPLAPLMGDASQNGGMNVVTGSVGAAVEEDGISDRLGAELWRVVRPAVAQAVEYGEDGAPIAWRSGSGKTGSVVAVAAYFDEDGDVCRRLTITRAQLDASNTVTAEACREGNLWRVRPAEDQV